MCFSKLETEITRHLCENFSQPQIPPAPAQNKKDEAREGFVLWKFSSLRDETDWLSAEL
jgi:hypothetical protein